MATKQEIIVGLKNAINRGESLQKAMQSFVNAGYNMNDVNKAATEVQRGLGTTGQTSPSPTAQTNNQEQIPPAPKKLPQEQMPSGQPKKKLPWKIIIISSILLLLLGFLAFILLRL